MGKSFNKPFNGGFFLWSRRLFGRVTIVTLGRWNGRGSFHISFLVADWSDSNRSAIGRAGAGGGARSRSHHLRGEHHRISLDGVHARRSGHHGADAGGGRAATATSAAALATTSTAAAGATVVDALVLDLETLGANLEAIHLLDGLLGRDDGVVADKAKALGLAGGTVDIDLGGNYGTKRIKGSGEVGVIEVVGQMIDEQVGTGGTLAGSGDGDVVAAASAAATTSSSLVGVRRWSVAARIGMGHSSTTLGVRTGLGLVHVPALLSVVLLGRISRSHGHAVVLGVLLVALVVAGVGGVGVVRVATVGGGAAAVVAGVATAGGVARAAAAAAMAGTAAAAGGPPLGVLDDDGTVAAVELDVAGHFRDGPVALLAVGQADEGAGLAAAVGILEEVDVLNLSVGGEHLAEVFLRQRLGDHADVELVLEVCCCFCCCFVGELRG